MMPVFRVEKNRDYTTMSNIHLRDKNLSLKSKGLLSQILSLPDGWNYSVNGLAAINRESRDSIRTAIAELETCGYIVRNRLRTLEGKLGDMEYVVYEKPVSEKPILENPMLENPTQVKPTQVKPTLENPPQLNTDISNKDLLSTERSSKDGMVADRLEPSADKTVQAATDEKKIYGEYRNVLLSDGDLEYNGLIN